MIDELLLRGLLATLAATLPSDERQEIATAVDEVRLRTIPDDEFAEGVELYYGAIALCFLAVGLLGILAYVGVAGAMEHLTGVALPGGPILSFGAFGALGIFLSVANYYRMRRAMRREDRSARPAEYRTSILLDVVLLLVSVGVAWT